MEFFEKSLSRGHNVKVTSFPGSTSDKIVEKLHDLIKDKPDDLTIHTGTSNVSNDVKSWKKCQKMHRE